MTDSIKAKLKQAVLEAEDEKPPVFGSRWLIAAACFITLLMITVMVWAMVTINGWTQ
jgi:hypothetical protein